MLGLGLFCLCLMKLVAQTNISVTNGNNTGAGSLRRAIHQANGSTSLPITITFSAAVTVVNLTDSIRINNTRLRFITINGGGDVRVRSTTTRTHRGLGVLTGAAIYGLQFENFSTAIDVSAGNCRIGGIGTTNSNVFLNNANVIVSIEPIDIIGNFIGTNRTGTTVNGNSAGITIQTLSSNSTRGPTISNNTFLGTNNIALTLLLSFGATVSNNTFGKSGTGFGNETAVYLLGGSMSLTENRFENNDKAVTITSRDNVVFRDNTYLCNRGTSLITYSSAYTTPTISSATYLHNGSVVLSGTSPAAGDSIEVYETFSTACTGTTPCQGFKQTRVVSNSGRNWFATVMPTSGKTFLANAGRVLISPGLVASSLPPYVAHSSLFTPCEIPDCPTMTVTFTKVNDVNCFGGNDGRATISIPSQATTGGSFRYYVAETELANPIYTSFSGSVTVQNLQNRTYTAFVENTLTGCKYKSLPLSIGQPSAPLSLTNCREVSSTTTPTAADGVGEVTVSGGSQAYTLTYQRTGFTPTTISVATPSTRTLSGLAAGTYTVVVTDSKHAAGNPKTGCTDTCTFTITTPTCSNLSLTVQQVTNVLCSGNSTGSILVRYNDLPANLPLTLRLIQGQITLRTIQITTLSGSQTHSFDNLPAGAYTITLSRGAACTVTRTANIGQPNTPLSINCQNIVHAARVGEASGSAAVAISGGTPNYQLNVTGGVTRTYTVTNTTSPFPIPNLPKGTYNVLVTDANNCSQTCNFTINDPDCTGFDVFATAAPVSCFGDNNGQIQLRPANGQAPFTYTWRLASIGNRDFANNLAADTYRITVTDNRLCRDTVGTRVNTPSVLRAVVTPQNVRTSGGSDGSIKILVLGGTRDYAAELILNTVSRPPTRRVLDTFFFENLSRGTYTYRVWDANDCDTSGTVILTDPNCNINIEATATPITCKNANNGKIRTTRTNGTAPFSYTWRMAGLTADSATNLPAGVYWVAIRDALNCTDTAFATILEPDSLYSLPQVSDVTRVNGNNGSIRITVIGGTEPYTVRLQNGTLATQISNNTFIFNGLIKGNYTYTVTDARGCTDRKTVTINDPVCGISVRIQTDSVSCNGGNDGRIRLTIGNANAPLSIRWSNGIANDLQTVENLRAGNYTFSITDNSGCTKDSNATVNQPTRLTSTFDTTKVTFVGLNNGTITVRVSGGTPPFTVKIGNDTTATALNATTFRFSNLGVGTYTYVVTDDKGCTTSQQVIIEGPNCNLNLTKVVVNARCNGSNNGGITFTPSGINYTWLPNVSTNNTANNLGIGMYRVTATDGFGCQKTDSATITQPTVLLSNANPRDVTILAPPNGSVAIGVSGGTAPYRVILNTDSLLIAAGDSARFSNLAAGNYTYTVRDNNGCTTTGTFTINPLVCNLSAPTRISILRDSVCSGASVTLTTPSVNQAVSYRWQTPVGVVITSAPNMSINNLNNSNSGIYTVILSFNGCESPPSPSVRLTVIDVANQRVFAGLDKTECGNTTTNLTATPLINASFTGNWQSLNAAVIAQNNQSNTAVSGLKSGNNGFVWSVLSSVCGLVGRDTMIVYVEKMPVLTEITLNLDSKSSSLLINMRELLRDSFNFKITITPPSQGFAQIQNGRFLFFDRANLTAAQRIEIPYRLCGLQCPNLCADSKLIIDIAASELDSQALDVQKLLSSNSSTSAFLEIKGTELLDEVECIIVDRWGTRVFGPVSYQNNTVGRAWDGTKNGKQLPNGAYYYSLRYTTKANKRTQRGIIYLVDGL